MGTAKFNPPVKLIAGFIFSDRLALESALRSLERKFGLVDFKSPVLDFTHTSYYEKEMGKDLKRLFVSFSKLIPPETLPSVKLFTNKIERKLSRNNLRRVNIDPGYLDLSKLILATTKDFRHRIYLNRGIYAEITLYFQKDSFTSWEWTYPDYRTKEYLDIFNCIRQNYYAQTCKPVK